MHTYNPGTHVFLHCWKILNHCYFEYSLFIFTLSFLLIELLFNASGEFSIYYSSFNSSFFLKVSLFLYVYFREKILVLSFTSLILSLIISSQEIILLLTLLDQ